MKKLTMTLVTLIGLNAFAASYEIKHMNEILNHVDKDTLVVFDIDNTIAESAQTIGSVQWQEYEVEKAKEAGLPADQALERSLRKFIAVNYASEMRPVESSTPKIIKHLQEKSAGVMALTARPAELLARTHYLLGKMGINLSLARPINGGLQTFAKEQSIYSNGIFAVGATNDKGEMLKWLMTQNGFAPFKKVVFVDDKAKYTKSISTALDKVGVQNDVFRYGAADQRVKNFDRSLANEQTKYFERTGKILKENAVLNFFETKITSDPSAYVKEHFEEEDCLSKDSKYAVTLQCHSQWEETGWGKDENGLPEQCEGTMHSWISYNFEAYGTKLYKYIGNEEETEFECYR